MFQASCDRIGADFENEKAMNVQIIRWIKIIRWIIGENYTFFRERESLAESSLKVR